MCDLSNGRTGGSDPSKLHEVRGVAFGVRVKHRVRILVGTRTCSSSRVLFAREKQSIAALDACAHQLTRGELDNGERAECERQPPRPDGRFHSQHLAVAIDERDVNCKAHEKRVDAVAGREDEGVAFGKTVAAEETAIPRLALERRFDDAGDERAVGWRSAVTTDRPGS